MKYAYFRVSTTEKCAKQNYERQEKILKDFSETEKITFDRVFKEHVSGGVRGDERKEFAELLTVVKTGDDVYVTETSRFGRNYIESFQMIDLMTIEMGVNLHFIANRLDVWSGKKLNPYEWLALSQSLLWDEFQKRQIGYNTAKTLQGKKERGIKLGRQPTYSEEEKKTVIYLYKKGLSVKDISEKTKISVPQLYRIIKEKKDEENS